MYTCVRACVSTHVDVRVRVSLWGPRPCHAAGLSCRIFLPLSPFSSHLWTRLAWTPGLHAWYVLPTWWPELGAGWGGHREAPPLKKLRGIWAVLAPQGQGRAGG